MADSGGSSASARRSTAVVLVAAAVVVAAAGVGGAVGAVSGNATTQTAADSNPVEFVYVNASTDSVTFVREDGTQVDTSASADVVGPMADLDSDGLLEAPYVTSNGDLRTIDASGESRKLDSGVPSAKTKVAVGDWTGDGVPEVVYPDTNNNVHYANVTGTPTRVGSESASAVLGVSDFDGDGGTDLVFVGTSQNLHYYDGSTTVDTQYGNFANSGAAGAPADFYGNGTLWVPVIDGSGSREIVNADGDVTEFQTSQNSTDKRPVAGVNWTGDSTLEILHLQGGEVAYTAADGSTQKITGGDGATMTAVQSAGVAGVASRPAGLSVSEFAATATGDQNVTVNVATNHDLSELNVTLDGPETAALTLAAGDFEETGTDPYSYTATYDGGTDGEYTATLESAASAGDATSGNTDTATVDDRVPAVESVNLTDATNGDGDVEAGDEVTVNATVSGDVDSVTADLSAFDAGTVTLTGDTGSYEANATVGADADDGDQNATVTASDGEGNTDSATTGALTVDTENLSVALNDTKTVEAGQSVEFSPANVSGATGSVDYDWTFDDGDSASGKTVTHTFDADGTYEVILTADDGSGDADTASMSVTVTTNETTTEGTTSRPTTTSDPATTTSDPATTTSDPATTEPTGGDGGDGGTNDPAGSSDDGTEPATATATPTTGGSAGTTTARPTESTTATATTAPTAERTPTANTAEPTTAASTTAEPGAENVPPQSPGEAPGFGVVAALLALLAAAGLALRE